MPYEAHVYHCPQIESLLADIVVFFEQTPLRALKAIQSFPGSGVYALYYTGRIELYQGYPHSRAIYVGKAVPTGWRQARRGETIEPKLHTRLREHERSIKQARNLKIGDFGCRFVIMLDSAVHLIGAVENALIRRYRPLWNSVIDGFGNHDPGSRRYNQAISEWDMLHPGRPWAARLTGTPPDRTATVEKVTQYIRKL